MQNCSTLIKWQRHAFFSSHLRPLRHECTNYWYRVASCTGCVRKTKLYNFQFLIAEKENKAQQQHFDGQNMIFLCVRRFLNIIPWSGVKVMVHWVMSGKNKVGHFYHYCESYGSSRIGETHSDLRWIKADVVKQPYLMDSSRPSDLNMSKIIHFGNAWPTQTHCFNLFVHFTLILFVYCSVPSMQFR